MAEAVLLNSEGETIATGAGKFVKSKIPLSPELGYA